PRPVGGAAHRVVRIHRLREQVVDEHDAVAHEDAVANRHARADERVARNLAVPADDRARLDLDERADLRVVADRAAIQVHELRLRDGDAVAKDHVFRNHSRPPAAGAPTDTDAYDSCRQARPRCTTPRSRSSEATENGYARCCTSSGPSPCASRMPTEIT